MDMNYSFDLINVILNEVENLVVDEGMSVILFCCDNVEFEILCGDDDKSVIHSFEDAASFCTKKPDGIMIKKTDDSLIEWGEPKWGSEKDGCDWVTFTSESKLLKSNLKEYICDMLKGN